MKKEEMVTMLADAFESGSYSEMEIDKMLYLFQALSTSQFKDLVGRMLMGNKRRGILPSLPQWQELWRDSKSEYFQSPSYTSGEPCGKCHEGWRYLLQSRAIVGQQVIQRCVARCDCPAGNAIAAMVPLVTHVEKRDDYAGALQPACSDAYIWPRKELGTGGEKQSPPWAGKAEC